METKERLKRKFIKWLGYDVEFLNEALEASIKDTKYFEQKYKVVLKEANELKDKVGQLETSLRLSEGAVKELYKDIEELRKDPIRNRLGSVDLRQVIDPLNSLEVSERKAYTAQIFSYRKLWKDEVEWLMKEQIEWWARNSLGMMFRDEKEQNAFARGNINFADLLLKRVEDIVQEHVENLQENKEKQEGKDENSAPLSSEAGLDVLNLVNQVKI